MIKVYDVEGAIDLENKGLVRGPAARNCNLSLAAQLKLRSASPFQRVNNVQ
jgi:hypothetical protein